MCAVQFIPLSNAAAGTEEPPPLEPAWLTMFAKGFPLSCSRSAPPPEDVLAAAGDAVAPPPDELSDIPNRSSMFGTGWSAVAAAAAGAAYTQQVLILTRVIGRVFGVQLTFHHEIRDVNHTHTFRVYVIYI